MEGEGRGFGLENNWKLIIGGAAINGGVGVTFFGGEICFVLAWLTKFHTCFTFRFVWVDWPRQFHECRIFTEAITSLYYVVTLVHQQVCNRNIHREIQEISNQLNHVLFNPEGYCEKSKKYPHCSWIFFDKPWA